MYHINKKHRIMIKFATWVFVCLFLINDMAWAQGMGSDPMTLAVSSEMSDPELKEKVMAMQFLLAEDGADKYIQEQIAREKDDKVFGKNWASSRTELIDIDDPMFRGLISYSVIGLESVMLVRIAGLFSSTGQPAHVGLSGKDYGDVPVIYIDSALSNTPDRCIQKHDIDEILQWESLRVNILHIGMRYNMRQWIIKHINIPDDELKDTKYEGMTSRQIAKQFHESSYPLETLYKKIKVAGDVGDKTADTYFNYDYIRQMLTLYGQDKDSENVNIAAHKQEWPELIYYMKRLDSDDPDARLVALSTILNGLLDKPDVPRNDVIDKLLDKYKAEQDGIFKIKLFYVLTALGMDYNQIREMVIAALSSDRTPKKMIKPITQGVVVAASRKESAVVDPEILAAIKHLIFSKDDEIVQYALGFFIAALIRFPKRGDKPIVSPQELREDLLFSSQVVLLSGDDQFTHNTLAKKLAVKIGLSEVISNISPEDIKSIRRGSPEVTQRLINVVGVMMPGSNIADKMGVVGDLMGNGVLRRHKDRGAANLKLQARLSAKDMERLHHKIAEAKDPSPQAVLAGFFKEGKRVVFLGDQTAYGVSLQKIADDILFLQKECNVNYLALPFPESERENLKKLISGEIKPEQWRYSPSYRRNLTPEDAEDENNETDVELLRDMLRRLDGANIKLILYGVSEEDSHGAEIDMSTQADSIVRVVKERVDPRIIVIGDVMELAKENLNSGEDVSLSMPFETGKSIGGDKVACVVNTDEPSCYVDSVMGNNNISEYIDKFPPQASFGIKIRGTPLEHLRFLADYRSTFGSAWDALIYRRFDDGGGNPPDAPNPPKPKKFVPRSPPAKHKNRPVGAIGRGSFDVGLLGGMDEEHYVLTVQSAAMKEGATVGDILKIDGGPDGRVESLKRARDGLSGSAVKARAIINKAMAKSQGYGASPDGSSPETIVVGPDGKVDLSGLGLKKRAYRIGKSFIGRALIFKPFDKDDWNAGFEIYDGDKEIAFYTNRTGLLMIEPEGSLYKVSSSGQIFWEHKQLNVPGIFYRDKQVVVRILRDEKGNNKGIRFYYEGKGIITYILTEDGYQKIKPVILERKVTAQGQISLGEISVDKLLFIGTSHAKKTVIVKPLEDGDWDSGFRLYVDGKKFASYRKTDIAFELIRDAVTMPEQIRQTLMLRPPVILTSMHPSYWTAPDGPSPKTADTVGKDYYAGLDEYTRKIVRDHLADYDVTEEAYNIVAGLVSDELKVDKPAEYLSQKGRIRYDIAQAIINSLRGPISMARPPRTDGAASDEPSPETTETKAIADNYVREFKDDVVIVDDAIMDILAPDAKACTVPYLPISIFERNKTRDICRLWKGTSLSRCPTNVRDMINDRLFKQGKIWVRASIMKKLGEDTLFVIGHELLHRKISDDTALKLKLNRAFLLVFENAKWADAIKIIFDKYPMLEMPEEFWAQWGFYALSKGTSAFASLKTEIAKKSEGNTDARKEICDAIAVIFKLQGEILVKLEEWISEFESFAQYKGGLSRNARVSHKAEFAKELKSMLSAVPEDILTVRTLSRVLNGSNDRLFDALGKYKEQRIKREGLPASGSDNLQEDICLCAAETACEVFKEMFKNHKISLAHVQSYSANATPHSLIVIDDDIAVHITYGQLDGRRINQILVAPVALFMQKFDFTSRPQQPAASMAQPPQGDGAAERAPLPEANKYIEVSTKTLVNRLAEEDVRLEILARARKDPESVIWLLKLALIGENQEYAIELILDIAEIDFNTVATYMAGASREKERAFIAGCILVRLAQRYRRNFMRLRSRVRRLNYADDIKAALERAHEEVRSLNNAGHVTETTRKPLLGPEVSVRKIGFAFETDPNLLHRIKPEGLNTEGLNRDKGRKLAENYLLSSNLQNKFTHCVKVGDRAYQTALRIKEKNPGLTDLDPEFVGFLGYVHDIGCFVPGKWDRHELETVRILKEEGITPEIADMAMHGWLYERFDRRQQYLPVGLEGVILSYADMTVNMTGPVSIEERAQEIEQRLSTLHLKSALEKEIKRSMCVALPRFKAYERFIQQLQEVQAPFASLREGDIGIELLGLLSMRDYIITIKRYACKENVTAEGLLGIDGGPGMHGGEQALITARRGLPERAQSVIDEAIRLYDKGKQEAAIRRRESLEDMLGALANATVPQLVGLLHEDGIVEGVKSELLTRSETLPYEVVGYLMSALKDRSIAFHAKDVIINIGRRGSAEVLEIVVKFFTAALKDTAMLPYAREILLGIADKYPVIVSNNLVGVLADSQKAAAAESILMDLSIKAPLAAVRPLVGALQNEKRMTAARRIILKISERSHDEAIRALVGAVGSDKRGFIVKEILLEIAKRKQKRVMLFLSRAANDRREHVSEAARDIIERIEAGGIISDAVTGRIKLKEGDFIEPNFELWAVRHGETDANKMGIFQGLVDGDLNQLNEMGKKQALEAAQLLYAELEDKIKSGKNIRVLTSDLGRAKATAQAFIDMVKDRAGVVLKPVSHNLLNEISFGVWDNKREEDLDAEQNKLVDRYRRGLDATVCPEGGQSFMDMICRGRRLLTELNRAYEGEIVVAFCHGTQSGGLRAAMGDRTLLDESGQIDWRKNMLPNAKPALLYKTHASDKPSNANRLNDNSKSGTGWKDIVIKPATQGLDISGLDMAKGKSIALRYLSAPGLEQKLAHSLAVGLFCRRLAFRIKKNNPYLDLNPEFAGFLGFVHDIGCNVKDRWPEHELETVRILIEQEHISPKIASMTMHGWLFERFGNDSKYLPIGLEGIILNYADMRVNTGRPVSIDERAMEIIDRVNGLNIDTDLRLQILNGMDAALPRYRAYGRLVERLMGGVSGQQEIKDIREMLTLPDSAKDAFTGDNAAADDAGIRRRINNRKRDVRRFEYPKGDPAMLNVLKGLAEEGRHLHTIRHICSVLAKLSDKLPGILNTAPEDSFVAAGDGAYKSCYLAPSSSNGKLSLEQTSIIRYLEAKGLPVYKFKDRDNEGISLVVILRDHPAADMQFKGAVACLWGSKLYNRKELTALYRHLIKARAFMLRRNKDGVKQKFLKQIRLVAALLGESGEPSADAYLSQPRSDAMSQTDTDIENAVWVINKFIPAQLEDGMTYEVRYDLARLQKNGSISSDKEHSAEALFMNYIKLLRIRVGQGRKPEDVIKIIDHPDENSLISVRCRRSTGNLGNDDLLEAHINVEGDIKGQQLNMVAMLNMVFTAAHIPRKDPDSRRDLMEKVKNRYREITGKELLPKDIWNIILPKSATLSPNMLKSYYELTIKRLGEAV